MLTKDQFEAATRYNEKQPLNEDHLNYLLAIGAASFQQGQGLTVDGKVGPKTKAALEDFLDEFHREDKDDDEVAVPLGLPEGKGMFIRSFRHTGSPDEMVATMTEAGIQWVCVQAIWQYLDRPALSVIPETAAEYAEAVHQAGAGFWLWGYPVPGKEDEFTETMFKTVDATKAQGIVVDAEKPYKKTTGAGRRLMQALMPGCVERGILLGFTSYGAPWFHLDFPWEEFNTAHFAINQSYDKDNNLGRNYPSRSQKAYRDLGFKVLIPGSGAWDKTEAQMTSLVAWTPTPQGSIIWWDWYNAGRDNLWGPIRRCQPTPSPGS